MNSILTIEFSAGLVAQALNSRRSCRWRWSARRVGGARARPLRRRWVEGLDPKRWALSVSITDMDNRAVNPTMRSIELGLLYFRTGIIVVFDENKPHIFVAGLRSAE